MKKEFSSYIFGFLDKDGEPYDYHISNDVNDSKTLEVIEDKFSSLNSKYLLVWRKDRQKFTTSEANDIIEHVKNNIQEFIEDISDSDIQNEPRSKFSMFIPSKDCIIIAYDKLVLPKGNINWKNFVDLVSFKIDDMINTKNQNTTNVNNF